jgi:predicted acetyltransferase
MLEQGSSSSAGNELVFFERTPYMSAELLDVADNYSVATYYDDDFFKNLHQAGYDIKTFGNTDFDQLIGSDVAVVHMLRSREFIRKIMEKRSNSHALFFYMNHDIDHALKNTGMNIAVPNYDLQERLGSKTLIPEICQKLVLPQNPSIILEFDSSNPSQQYDNISKNLGTPFVIQGATGVSGEDTFLIENASAFARYGTVVTGYIKASKYLENIIPISMHACIADDQVSIEGPYPQIIGFDTLTTNPFQFAGNDTSQSMFSASFIEVVKLHTEQVATFLRNNGYSGIAGVDFLWDQNTNVPYLQEINARLVGLTRLLTGIQIKQKVLPSIVRQAEIFMGKGAIGDFSDHAASDSIDTQNQNYSQIIVANNSQQTASTRKTLDAGIYQTNIEGKIHKRQDSVFMKDMQEDDVLVTMPIYQDCHFAPEAVLTKIILASSALEDGKYELKKGIVDIVHSIREHVFSSSIIE